MRFLARLITALAPDYCEDCGWWTKPGCGH